MQIKIEPLLRVMGHYCTTHSWVLPPLAWVPDATVKAKLILKLVTDKSIDPHSSGLVENNQTQSYWLLPLICQLKVSHFLRALCWQSSLISSLCVCACVWEFLSVSLRAEYSICDLPSYLIFLCSLLDDTKYVSAHSVQNNSWLEDSSRGNWVWHLEMCLFRSR